MAEPVNADQEADCQLEDIHASSNSDSYIPEDIAPDAVDNDVLNNLDVEDSSQTKRKNSKGKGSLRTIIKGLRVVVEDDVKKRKDPHGGNPLEKKQL